MKSFLCFATFGILALAMSSYAQDSKKDSAKAEITKAVFMVDNLHCPLCATTLQGAMKKVEGVKFIYVNYNTKSANINFDEKVISAQEVARAMYQAPHAMGPKMQYGGALLLSVPDAKDKAAGAKATVALRKVEGVANVMFFPQPRTVGIQFTDKGKVTSADLFSALEQEGLKGRQYGAKK
jgi:copper chaperone CopZ